MNKLFNYEPQISPHSAYDRELWITLTYFEWAIAAVIDGDDSTAAAMIDGMIEHAPKLAKETRFMLTGDILCNKCGQPHTRFSNFCAKCDPLCKPQSARTVTWFHGSIQ